MTKTLMNGFAAFLLFVGFSTVGQIAKADLAVPSGAVVLSISGDIGVASGDTVVEFDVDMLEALPQNQIRTETPWHDGMPEFSGPMLSTLVDSVEGTGGTVRVVALNDYAAEIPLDEIRKYPVILATRINGTRIPVREKGPLFVIYPFSDAPELYNEMTFNRSVWQVVSLIIE